MTCIDSCPCRYHVAATFPVSKTSRRGTSCPGSFVASTTCLAVVAVVVVVAAAAAAVVAAVVVAAAAVGDGRGSLLGRID